MELPLSTYKVLTQHVSIWLRAQWEADDVIAIGRLGRPRLWPPSNQRLSAGERAVTEFPRQTQCPRFPLPFSLKRL